MIDSETQKREWLALDVGGANLKAAHSAGAIRSVPFELWKQPDQLARALETMLKALPAFTGLAVTMTAELCDCFVRKSEGVLHVLDAVESVAGAARVVVWGVDGRFHEVEEVRSQPMLAAAANWLALAEYAARWADPGPGLLIDIGSTTTDIIPLRGGRACPLGRTDTERLRTGELVYAGVRRTPLCALGTHVRWKGGTIGLAAELFATTLDVYLILGELCEDSSDTSTADGRSATRTAARQRLARMIAADASDLTESETLELATAFEGMLVERLAATVNTLTRCFAMPSKILVAGSGSFLSERVADEVVRDPDAVLSLESAWGRGAAHAGCAYSVLKLAQERVRW